MPRRASFVRRGRRGSLRGCRWWGSRRRSARGSRRRGRWPPIACIPDGESIGILQMLGGLDALSPADKKLPLKDGYARVLAKTYPCQRN